MKTTIKDLNGRDVDLVYDIITSRPEIYGKVTPQDMMHPHFFGVYNDEDKLVAFYGVSYWYNRERILCYVWVSPECRKRGIFNKIINRVKTEYPKDQIGIWAASKNLLANEIYSKKFDCMGYDPDSDANYYGIHY